MASLRRLAAVGAVVFLAGGGGASAHAATPQKIYRDLADNGRIDGKYTETEIERAFDLSSAVRTDGSVVPRKPIEDNRAPQVSEPARVDKPEKRVPFSALDAALLVAGGGPMLLVAVGLRRRLAAAPSDAPAPIA